MHERLLITGGAGFIGSNFSRNWLAEYPCDRLIIFDSLSYAGELSNLDRVLDDSRVVFVEADINETDKVEQLLRDEMLTTVVHFAAESHVDRSITGPDAFVQTNILGTHSLLKAARQVWQVEKLAVDSHHFHHISTDEVYGTLGPNDPAFTEETSYRPNSPYAASKAASDHLVRAYHETYGLNTTISNCSNNYGPYQHREKLIPQCIYNALHGKAIPIYGDGSNVRDWLHVHDHCRGVAKILEDGRYGEAYNIGGNNEWSNLDLVELLLGRIDALFTNDSEMAGRFNTCPASQGHSCLDLVEFVTDRAGHDWRYAINSEKMVKELSFVIKGQMTSGLDETIRWIAQRCEERNDQ